MSSGLEARASMAEMRKRKRAEEPLPPSVIVLTGAPSASSLDWHSDALSAPLLPIFDQTSSQEEIGAEGRESMSAHDLPSGGSSITPAAWRVLPVEHQFLHTDLTPPDLLPGLWAEPSNGLLESISFVSSASFTSDKSTRQESAALACSADGLVGEGENVEEARSQFWEQSMVLHTEIQSSQVLGLEYDQDEAENAATTTSKNMVGNMGPISNDCYNGRNFDDQQTGNSNPTQVSATDFTASSSSLSQSSHEAKTLDPPQPLARKYRGHPAPYLTPLSAVPSASYVHGIKPQIKTVNLVVVLLSVASIRTIIPRRYQLKNNQRPLELLELTVADETRAGFGVNIWVPPILGPMTINNQGTGVGLRDTAISLRPRDIILIRNVALGAWRGAVYGQTLRREQTRLDVLWRGGGTSGTGQEMTGIYREQEIEGLLDGDEGDLSFQDEGEKKGKTDPFLSKAQKLRRWMRDFLGPVAAQRVDLLEKRVEAKARSRRGTEACSQEDDPDHNIDTIASRLLGTKTSAPTLRRILPPDSQD